MGARCVGQRVGAAGDRPQPPCLGMLEQDEQADRLEREGRRLEHEGERVEQHIDEARSDWKQKESSSSVPGAQPEPDEEEVMETPYEESDQLPEDAPSEQVVDDVEGDARDETEESPGVPGEEETATGNPDAAGEEDPEE